MIIDFSSTSSGPLGYSGQKNWLGCGARALVEENQKIRDKAAGVVYPPYPEEKKADPRLLGSLFGEMIQRYHKGNPVNPSDRFTWDGVSIEDSHPLTCYDARHYVDEYVKKTRQDAYGKMVGSEVFCKIPAELFGQELTGAIDGVMEDERGIWITDWKTEGRNEKWLKDKYSIIHQNWLYALAYELSTGVKPIGVRYVVVVKTKENPIFNYEFEGVDEWRFKWLKRFFEVVERRRALPIAEPSHANCLAFNRPCSYLVNNKCSLL